MNHIRGYEIKTQAEFVGDDQLWLVKCTPTAKKTPQRADSEFFMRLLPCPHHPDEGAGPLTHSMLFFSNLAPSVLQRAMDIGLEALSQHGLLPDDEEED